MGLSAVLSNALSGMAVGQSALEVVSRNVANSGTPGYHVQTLSVVDGAGVNSSYARTGQVQRAFDTSLQNAYTAAASDAGYASTRLATLDRLQTYFGMPGGDGSLDTVYANFQTALQSLSTSPDNYATRANALQTAQTLTQTLNSLSGAVQGLRQDAETQMGATVTSLNQAISSLQKVNAQLGSQSGDLTARASLEDQRDRLVAQVAEMVDVRASYASDGSVSLMTRSGVSIIDGAKASTFTFQPAGTMTPTKLFDVDADGSGVGQLTLTTAAGNTIDLVQQKALQSGTLAALVELRDNTLVNTQSQLDAVAGGVAKAFSTIRTAGTAVTSGTLSGYSLDLSTIRDGNDFVLDYGQGGSVKSVRVVSVDDANRLPLDYVDANGTRVVGVTFSSPANVAQALQGVLGPSFSVSASGTTLTVLDDGAAGTTDVDGLTGDSTATGTQTGDPAFSLFTDSHNLDFTGSRGGDGQQTGFAARIQVNTAVLGDNTLLVKFQPTTSVGDPTRPNQALDHLQSMIFASLQDGSTASAFRLGGSVSDMIAQTMDGVGNVAATAATDNDTQQMTMDAVNQRLDTTYGVNVDDEMARLILLQNAYAANARVISSVQELLNRLLNL